MNTSFLWQGLLATFLFGCEKAPRYEKARSANQLVQNLPTLDDKTKAETPKDETKTIQCETKANTYRSYAVGDALS